MINEILEIILKSKKTKFSKPYNDDETVLVSVRIDNLKVLSKLKLSKVKMLDSINSRIINDMKIKKVIFKSSSLILDSLVNKFLLKILFGFTNL